MEKRKKKTEAQTRKMKMKEKNMAVLVLVLVLSIFSYMSEVKAAFEKYEIHIINNLPNSILRVHPQSKDNDLGYHNLNNGQDYTWSFKVNFPSTTLYFAHFWWNNKKQKSFNVFDIGLGMDYCGYNIIALNRCYWYVKEDGFYIQNNYKSGHPLKKMYDWDS